jgi:hypothetical protein
MPSLPQYEHQTYFALGHLLPPEITNIIAQHRFLIFKTRISSLISPLQKPVEILNGSGRFVDGLLHVHTEVMVNQYLLLHFLITPTQKPKFRVYRPKNYWDLNIQTNVWEKRHYRNWDLASIRNVYGWLRNP